MLIGWAVRLHLKRWARYRTDVFVWTITIWMTIGMQATFVFVTYRATGGELFGYSAKELIAFFGITLLATGLAQTVVHGIILHLARSVWSGNFDFWILQPAPLFLRMLLEEIGLIWFWPHIVVGTIVMILSLEPSSFIIAFPATLLAALLEVGIVLCLSIPSVRWGRWDPHEGAWEYMESARSVPIGQSKKIMLWLASFGVLQYSLALQIATGRWPLWILAAAVLLVCTTAWLLFTSMIRSYSSASS